MKISKAYNTSFQSSWFINLTSSQWRCNRKLETPLKNMKMGLFLVSAATVLTCNLWFETYDGFQIKYYNSCSSRGCESVSCDSQRSQKIWHFWFEAMLVFDASGRDTNFFKTYVWQLTASQPLKPQQCKRSLFLKLCLLLYCVALEALWIYLSAFKFFFASVIKIWVFEWRL